MIASSPPLSPAAIIETVLHEEGEMELEEIIDGLKIRYPHDRFSKIIFHSFAGHSSVFRNILLHQIR